MQQSTREKGQDTFSRLKKCNEHEAAPFATKRTNESVKYKFVTRDLRLSMFVTFQFRVCRPDGGTLQREKKLEYMERFFVNFLVFVGC